MFIPAYPYSSAFHSQQAAEKALKGYLVAHYLSHGNAFVSEQLDPPRTHDLRRLRDCIGQLNLPVGDALNEFDCAHLTGYAVAARYSNLIRIDESQAWQAISVAQRLCDVVRRALGVARP